MKDLDEIEDLGSDPQTLFGAVQSGKMQELSGVLPIGARQIMGILKKVKWKSKRRGWVGGSHRRECF